MAELKLPDASGRPERYALRGVPVAAVRREPPKSRIALAAAHVVVDPFADARKDGKETIDWDATVSVRSHLAGLGLGIAEAMDTSQRGMGLGPEQAMELVERSNASLTAEGHPPVYAGCGTDGIAEGDDAGLDGLKEAYVEQVGRVQKAGARVIVMASRRLAALAKGPEDYAEVYREVLGACDEPAILHWLGEMFDPALAGYWGAPDAGAAMDACLGIIAENSRKVGGIKLSLLDERLELEMRARLPEGVRMYTGDDFNYPSLITGNGDGHSDALLGVLGPIAPVASAALAALDEGDAGGCRRMLDTTVGLARHVFKAPTMNYKTGVAFLAWLNGLQDHFVMVAGAQSARPLPHFTELFRLADGCGLLADPDLAAERMAAFMVPHGFRQ